MLDYSASSCKLKIQYRGLLALGSLSVVVLDQISKYFAKNFFEISCNTGLSFGVNTSNTLAIVISCIVLAYLFYLLIRGSNQALSISLIFSGGFSNLIDRLLVGCVRDFINFGFWPSFNLADSAITIGVLILIYQLLQFAKQKNNEV